MLFWCVFHTCFCLVFNLYTFPTEMAIKQMHIFANNRVSIHAFTGFLFLFFVRQD